ncbi:BMP family lipoprotein [Saccharothrix obliqua]|uniref:BMP family lipoprotein n=1 Tax=Saccharothrix obliqua TaxID=2861747 RepID=UPI001C5DB1E4|nr:BMP family ABC transporter substrate-binding protein [Saccharothrix obliqua]MBW4716121.1 BMP family ABC transporter substrate-binding protein [Saccharothrix obliqua]
MRGIAVAAIALTSVLSMAACAKDNGGSSSGSANNNASGGCKLADKPPVAGAGTSSSSAGEKVDGSALKVGLAYDIGGRGDASFNDSAAAGLDKAKADFGVAEVKELTAAPNEAEDAKQTRLRQLASEGFNPIIGVGFAYAESLKVVAPEFPNVKFAIVDGAVDGAANVTPLVFAEEEGSFLAGVIAAYQSKSCHVGFVGGVKIPLIQKFDAGFEQGAKAAAPEIKIEKKYLTPAGDFTGFQEPTKGQEAAKGQIEAGADVLYHAAGASGKGVFSAAKSANVKAIGVDSDQYHQTTVADSKDVIVSSMLKRVDVAVYDFVKAVAKNDLANFPKVFDLKVDGVGYSTSGDKIDDNLKQVLDGYKSQIIEGKIKVTDKPSS